MAQKRNEAFDAFVVRHAIGIEYPGGFVFFFSAYFLVGLGGASALDIRAGTLRAPYTRELNFIVRFITWFISFCQISTVIRSASSLSLHLAYSKQSKCWTRVKDHTWSLSLSRARAREKSQAFLTGFYNIIIYACDSASLLRQDSLETHSIDGAEDPCHCSITFFAIGLTQANHIDADAKQKQEATNTVSLKMLTVILICEYGFDIIFNGNGESVHEIKKNQYTHTTTDFRQMRLRCDEWIVWRKKIGSARRRREYSKGYVLQQ